MSAAQVASPQCVIEVYPFEGGKYSIQGGSILALQVEKNLLGDSGSFQITLAPGGPQGPNFGPSWVEILTPMSFCLIGMRRGDAVGIVMIGVISSVEEVTKWLPDNKVIRVTQITGFDFQYFFVMWGYYSLFFLGLTPEYTDNPSQSLAILNKALLQGTPAEVGKSWYDNIMAGANGILAQTYVPFRGGQVTFPNAMATWFQDWENFQIPFADYFISSEGAWLNKFRDNIFPFPWYEFFVITAPVGEYPSATPAANPFSMLVFGEQLQASPTLVARINPQPFLIVAADGNSFTGIDVSLWNGLTSYALDGAGFIESNISFSDSGVKNFYTINPTWFRSLFGLQDNAGIGNFPFLYTLDADVASIHRYGFRVADGTISWFSDPTGNQSSNSSAASPAATVGDITGRLCSWHEPMPLMAFGTVKIPLRPDIIPGNKWTYNPFKGRPSYDFYIQGVAHTYEFGGPSTTTLTLSRGLPSSVYADTGLLFNVFTGNAYRLEGNYVPGLPSGLAGPALSPVNTSQIRGFMASLAKIYQTPTP